MRKKIKGFSLVELIIAITLLAAIGLLIGVNFNKIFNKEEKGNYEEFVNKIKSASDVYLTSNSNLLTELNTNRAFIEIKIKDLKEAGLISDDLKDPKTGNFLNADEIVLISLDDSGTAKFTYPAEKKGEYLQSLNKILNYNSTFECIPEADLDTINFGLINDKGNLVNNYFKSDRNKITCKTTEINTKKIGTYVVKYSYINPEGITKDATRNFIVIDHLFPTVSANYSPTSWTKENVTISATITDNESGIAAYAINLNNCGDFTKTSKNQISSVVSTNGTYSVCAKDVSGNIKEEKVIINNIDKTAPNIANINKSTTKITPSLTISTTITDNDSGIIAYTINQSSSTPTTWTNISGAASKAVSQTVTANGTYYVWAKDAVGNISSKSIKITTIATLKTISFSTGELSSSTYNGTYNTGVTISGIKSINVNTGQVTSYSFSGTKILFTLKYGSSKTRSYTTTCTTPATIKYYCKAVELSLCQTNKCCWDSPYESAGKVYGSAQSRYTCSKGDLFGSTCYYSCPGSYKYYSYTVTIEYYA